MDEKEKIEKAREYLSDFVLFCDDELGEQILVNAGLIKSFEKTFAEKDMLSEEKSAERAEWFMNRNKYLIMVMKSLIEYLESKKKEDFMMSMTTINKSIEKMATEKMHSSK